MVSCAAGFSEPSGSLKPSCSGGAHLRPFDRTPSTAPSPIGSDRNGTGSSRRRAPPSTWAHVHSLATHPLPTCLSPPHPRSFSRRRLGRRFSCPGARCLLCLTGLHRDCTQLSISAPLLTTAGAARWRPTACSCGGGEAAPALAAGCGVVGRVHAGSGRHLRARERPASMASARGCPRPPPPWCFAPQAGRR